MSVATRQEESARSRRAPAGQGFGRTGRGRYRVDALGALALLVATAGLVATLLLFRAPPPVAEPRSGRPLGPAPVWTIERANFELVNAAPQSGPAADDRAVVANRDVRDRWYLEAAEAPAASEPSAQARDRWYLDDRSSPRTGNPDRGADPTKERMNDVRPDEPEPLDRAVPEQPALGP